LSRSPPKPTTQTQHSHNAVAGRRDALVACFMNARSRRRNPRLQSPLSLASRPFTGPIFEGSSGSTSPVRRAVGERPVLAHSVRRGTNQEWQLRAQAERRPAVCHPRRPLAHDGLTAREASKPARGPVDFENTPGCAVAEGPCQGSPSARWLSLRVRRGVPCGHDRMAVSHIAVPAISNTRTARRRRRFSERNRSSSVIAAAPPTPGSTEQLAWRRLCPARAIGWRIQETG
jgi:hypothetical protein